MNLYRLRLRGYKSIKTWVDLKVAGNFGAIVGKNGTGKTNLLEAITIVLKDIYYDDVNTSIEYQAYFLLNKKEFATHFPEFEYTTENALLMVTNDTLDSKIMRIRRKKLEKYKDNIFEAANSYLGVVKKELRIYRETILEFQETRDKYVKDGFKHEAVVSRYKVNTTTNETRNKVLEIDELLKLELVRNEQGVISFKENYKFSPLNDQTYFKVKIKEKEVPVASVNSDVQQSFIDQSKNEVEAFNRRYDKLDSYIIELRNNLNEKLSNLVNILASSQSKIIKNDELITEFEKKFKKEFEKNVIFLNIQTSLKNPDASNRTQESALKNDSDSMSFLQMIAPYVFDEHELPKVNKILTNYYAYIEHGSMMSVIETKLTQFINDTLKKITTTPMRVSITSENHNLELNIIENTGEVVKFSETNTGRKMLFHYLFYRSILKEGDVFIIDEPAVYFHPSAQQELFRDLVVNATKRDITIIYATHSPYIMGKEIKVLNRIEMTPEGTKVVKIRTSEEMFDKYSRGLMSITKAIF